MNKDRNYSSRKQTRYRTDARLGRQAVRPVPKVRRALGMRVALGNAASRRWYRADI
jgi:hypothetical protein